MSVTWVQDANSNYEVSSVNHLLQLMHEGTLFTDAGTPPSSYLSSNYVQTVDIDLAAEAANIVPIGSVSSGDFTGGYDGQNHSISNWSFDAAGFGLEIGFICVLSGAVVKNLVLDGVWVFLNCQDAGFLVGRTRSVAGIYNITTNFASGTRLVGGVAGSLGVIVGYARSVSIHNVTVGGIIDECSGNAAVGGVIGNASSGCQISHLRNIATFTTPIQGNNVGGIAGNFDSTGSHFMNAMTGDIYGSGIFGRVRNSVSDVVNSMRGNITGAGIAETAVDQTFTRVMNYMTGDAVYGLFGNVGTSTIEKSVVAMNGTTQYAAIQANAGSSEILLDTSFGLIAEFTNDTITTMDLSSFDGVDPGTGLPYISFAFTDPVGNFIDWAFIFGNVPPFSLTARPLSIAVSFLAIDGAVAYRVTVQETGGSVVTVADGFSGLSISAYDLKSETEYTVRLFSTSDMLSSYTLQYEETTTTLENIPANYDISDFEVEQGLYDISDNNAGTVFLRSVIHDVFTTGDELIVPLPNGAPTKSTFVNRGDSYTIVDKDALVIPFEADAGASQTVSMILSDSTSVAVVYDEVNETVSIGGTAYSSGDSTIIDGKKMTISDI